MAVAEVVSGADPIDDPQEVIVLLLWHLGDVLNSTAFIPQLAAKHGRPITVATTAPCVPLVRHHPDVGRVRIIDRAFPSVFPRALWDELEALSEEIFPNHAFVYNLHIPVKLTEMPHSIYKVWGDALGIDYDLAALRPRFYPDPKFEAAPRTEDILLLCNGGSAPDKRWPLRRWQRLVDWLEREHPELHLLQAGGSGDTRIPGIEDARGGAFQHGHALALNARACVSNDSFFAHLAASAGCQTVAIFGPSCALQFSPLGPHVTAVGGHGYRTPCSRNLCRLVDRWLPCVAFPSYSAVQHALGRVLAAR